MTSRRTIRVGALTRVEGEGALHVELRDGVPERVELNIYEPPRFFEAFLRGRTYSEPPDLTARICGICPVAYQISACNAIEDACGVTLDAELIALRRLLYCGEWIHSHALHIYMLHAPDFHGVPDIIAMARDHRDLTVDHELLALTGQRYPLEDGHIARSAGTPFGVAEFSEHVRETQVRHSTALHATLDGGRHLTGPLARYSLNYDKLSPLAREAAAAGGLGPQCRNPFRSIVVRAVETVYAVEEALRIIGEYRPPARPHVPVEPRPGIGHGVSEAPRGLLYHRYEIDDNGLIADAVIVPPTAQNQGAIEADLTEVVAADGGLDDAALTAICERTIRNYDPCISCATHFLTVEVTRR